MTDTEPTPAPAGHLEAALIDLILDAELRLADTELALATATAEIAQKRQLLKGLAAREATLRRALALAEWRDRGDTGDAS